MESELKEELIKNQDKLKAFLRNLFQFDNNDLNFGIYRIMKYKRQSIEKFIDTDLIKEIENQFNKVNSYDIGSKEKKFNELKIMVINTIGNKISESGKIDEKYKDFPIVQEYERALDDLNNSSFDITEISNIYNLIYEFFSRYYDKGDFLSKKRYGGKNHYIIPYNGEEILFTWANSDQYYVKTRDYSINFSFKISQLTINFKVRDVNNNIDSITEKKRFFIMSAKDFIDYKNKSITIWFEYRSLNEEEIIKLNPKNLQNDLIDDAIDKLKENKIFFADLHINEENELFNLIKKNLQRYVQRNTTDYFIHKNLKSFFRRELEFFVKNEVLDLDEMKTMNEKQLKVLMVKMDCINAIFSKIIDFISQIEDFQKKLFEKKKFILKTNYCISIGLIPEEFYNEIVNNEEQILYWKSIYHLDEITKNSLYPLGSKNILDIDFLKLNPYLVIDTRFFSEQFKDKVIGTYDNLDEKIGGLIIKSENFQALNLIKKKYFEKIKCIYLDPPYNTGNDEFLYKDNYQHSSWLTMLDNRVTISKDMLSNQGIIFISIDDKEIGYLRNLLDNIFTGNLDNRLGTLIWDLGTGTTAGHFTRSHEYILSYAKNKAMLPNFDDPNGGIIKHGALKKISKANPATDIEFPTGMEYEPGGNREFSGIIGGNEQQIIDGKMIFENGKLKYPVKIKAGWAMRDQILSWLRNEETFDSKNQKVRKFYFNREGILWYEKDREKINPKTVISNKGSTKDGTSTINDLFYPETFFQFPKPPKLIRFLLSLTTDKNDIVMDFFAGSGTTAESVLKLNMEDNGKRKYILIESGDHFDTILKRRIEKLMYCQEWEDGKPKIGIDGIKHIFKYHYLEQYEDSLDNIILNLDDELQESLDKFNDYFLKYMLNYESKQSSTLLNIDKFSDPFNYMLMISGKESSVDIIETFNYILGLTINKIKVLCDDNGREYKIVEGQNNDGKVLIIWRNTEEIDYLKDKEFVEHHFLKGKKFNKIYVNGGDSLIGDAEILESVFKIHLENIK